MAKAEWGIKRICPNCGTRYYDMRKDPPTCPSCGTTFDPEALLRSRRARPIPVEEVKAKVAPETEDEDTLGVDAEEEETVADDPATEDEDLEVADIEEEDVAEDVGSDEEDDVLLEDADELTDEDDMGEVVDVEGDEDR